MTHRDHVSSPKVSIDETIPLTTEQRNAVIGLIVGLYEDRAGERRSLTNAWVIENVPNCSRHMFVLIHAGYAAEFAGEGGARLVGISEAGEAWAVKHLGMPLDRDERRVWVRDVLEPRFRRAKDAHQPIIVEGRSSGSD